MENLDSYTLGFIVCSSLRLKFGEFLLKVDQLPRRRTCCPKPVIPNLSVTILKTYGGPNNALFRPTNVGWCFTKIKKTLLITKLRDHLFWSREYIQSNNSGMMLDPFLSLLKPDRVVLQAEMSALIVEEEKEVTIACTASGQPRPTINWQKIGGKLSSDIKIKEGKLTLVAAQLWDEGTYNCEATNVINTETAEVKVTVVPKVEFQVTPPQQIEAVGGNRIQLDCQGTRLSKVTWQREGGNLPTGHLLHPNGTLVLPNVSDNASGVYVCKVSTIFRSINTTTQVKVSYRSCSHLKTTFPSKISGKYFIDPDEEGGNSSFVAHCDMIDKGGVGVTVVSHDRENRKRLTDFFSVGCFIRDVTYNDVTLTQLANLARVSSHCQQFIMFECKSDVEFIGEKAAWWVSRDGKPMYYWGGAIPYSGRCACGMTNTCEGGGRCNCKNWGPRGWRKDSGLLTDKFSLPVTQLWFKDWWHTYYTLGTFKCYGVMSNTGIMILFVSRMK